MNAKRMILIIGLCVLIFQGTAYGVIGVDDNVPAQELIFPFICEGTTGATPGDPPVFVGGLNTLWAYAETKGLDTRVVGIAYDMKGEVVLDYVRNLTPRDVDSQDCTQIVQMMDYSSQLMLKITIDGKSYFAGYLSLKNADGEDNLIGWTYFFDPTLLYASTNFKPYEAEGGADPATFAEGMGAGPIYSDKYYLRYRILNGNPETYNWWIVLRGESACPPSSSFCTSITKLGCIICNEDENCLSVDIDVPARLNIINVKTILPGSFLTYPKAGFAYCRLVESGRDQIQGVPFTNTDFTAFTWLYERQQIISENTCTNHVITDNALWSVIDPADRLRH